ncbi:hypothetical protein HYT32_00990, partial [Candidatus Roizmanbacteria bacterium]|nr:hypothetical protein [Candidatus Roizmanbacteria bacterium]
ASFGTGGGRANPNDWLIEGTSWERDFFTDSRNSVPTSYGFLLATAQGSGITPEVIDGSGAQPECIGGSGLSNCRLKPNLDNRIYIANGHLTIEDASLTFRLNRDYVILVDGNLTINTDIIVDTGSTVVFSASGDIIVNAVDTSGTPITKIEGLYSADDNFIVNAGTNNQLIIQGTVVANADLDGGTFTNNRDLGALNATTPSVKFTERPDFIVNYPSGAVGEACKTSYVAPIDCQMKNFIF